MSSVECFSCKQESKDYIKLCKDCHSEIINEYYTEFVNVLKLVDEKISELNIKNDELNKKLSDINNNKSEK